MKKLTLIFFLFASGLQAQVLWGINTDSSGVVNSWLKKENSNGDLLYSRDNVGDFDYVSGNKYGFLFYRKDPPDYMFREIFDYLKNILGPPTSSDDYTPELDYKMETAVKVRLGKWKYDKEWDFGSKVITFVWKENKLYVNCLYK